MKLLSLRLRARLRAVALLCALAATGCHGRQARLQTPLLHTVYGVFDPALERLQDIGTPVAVRGDTRRLKIVQFMGPIQPAWRRILVDRGMPIRGYMPDDAYVVEATVDEARALATLPMVRAVVDEPRLWRIDPRLIEKAGAPEGPTVRQDVGPTDVTIELSNDGDRDEVAAMVRGLQGEVLDDAIAKPAGRVLHARLAAAQIDAVAADADVSAVELFDAVHPDEDMPGGPARPKVPDHAARDHGLQGEDQVIATCDVGVFTNACYFSGDKILDYQNVTVPNEHAHARGTHSAGAIAGNRDDDGLYRSSDGAAPAARLFVQDAGLPVAGQMAVPPDLGALFEPAYRAGARVAANAWTGATDTYGARERSLDAFVAAHRDFVVVAATGNAGGAPATVSSPATAKNVISVGAAGGVDAEDVAAFSAAGPTADNRIKPTLVAPGEGIVAAESRAVCAATPTSGTSMAASRVAGAAALVRQYYEEGFYPTGVPDHGRALKPSAALIKATLLAGTDDMVGQGTGGSFPAFGQGFGRLRVDNALGFGDADRHLAMHDDQEGLAQSEAFIMPVQVGDGPLHVALAWTDEPAVAGAATALVNDLDLEMVGPDGTRWFGNQLNAGESVTHPQSDHTNVEEILYLARPTPGLYQLTVRAHNVPMGPQPYALVVSGNLIQKQF